jgi:hypothetical protein
VGVNGTYYAFDDITNQIERLNLANGSTTFVSNFDPAAGLIQGAAATPEAASTCWWASDCWRSLPAGSADAIYESETLLSKTVRMCQATLKQAAYLNGFVAFQDGDCFVA